MKAPSSVMTTPAGRVTIDLDDEDVAKARLNVVGMDDGDRVAALAAVPRTPDVLRGLSRPLAYGHGGFPFSGSRGTIA